MPKIPVNLLNKGWKIPTRTVSELKNSEGPKKHTEVDTALSLVGMCQKVVSTRTAKVLSEEVRRLQAKESSSVLLAQIARLDDEHRKCIVINVGAVYFTVLVVNGWVQSSKNVYPIERLPELDSIIIHEVDKCLSTPKIPI